MRYRGWNVLSWLCLPAPVTGMLIILYILMTSFWRRMPFQLTDIDIRSLTRFQFPVVVAGMDNQLKKVSTYVA